MHPRAAGKVGEGAWDWRPPIEIWTDLAENEHDSFRTALSRGTCSIWTHCCKADTLRSRWTVDVLRYALDRKSAQCTSSILGIGYEPHGRCGDPQVFIDSTSLKDIVKDNSVDTGDNYVLYNVMDTGQWSEPRISGWISAFFTFLDRVSDTKT
jgi:hypothetical protein